MPATPLAVRPVTSLVTDDGLVARLVGALDAAALPALRTALLGVRAPGCDDVIVDAGGVTEVDESALAALLAARSWVEDTGGRFAFSAVSDALRESAEAWHVTDELPLLPPLAGRDRPAPALIA